jgi:hypothetical protein
VEIGLFGEIPYKARTMSRLKHGFTRDIVPERNTS